jgi:hypothetical protein
MYSTQVQDWKKCIQWPNIEKQLAWLYVSLVQELATTWIR